MSATAEPVGDQLRAWRERRRLTQLELSLRADVSTRHLSWVETGRSRPTAAMVERLAGHLELPLRERNRLLLAAGHAPAHPEHDWDAPDLAVVRASLHEVLLAHEPHPAVLLNRWWELLDANAATAPLLEGVDPALLEAPVNVLRLSLHPDGLARRIRNLGQWRAHLLEQLHRRLERTADPRLAALEAEVAAYPAPEPEPVARDQVVVPLRLADERAAHGELSFFSLTAHVDTAGDVTVDELVVEAFYPADEETRALLARGRDQPGAVRG